MVSTGVLAAMFNKGNAGTPLISSSRHHLFVDKAQDFLTFILTNQSFRSNRSLINGVLFTVNAGLGRLLDLE